MCLGWKRKAGGDSGRAPMFAELLWAGHCLVSPLVGFSEAHHSDPSFIWGLAVSGFGGQRVSPSS